MKSKHVNKKKGGTANYLQIFALLTDILNIELLSVQNYTRNAISNCFEGQVKVPCAVWQGGNNNNNNKMIRPFEKGSLSNDP